MSHCAVIKFIVCCCVMMCCCAVIKFIVCCCVMICCCTVISYVSGVRVIWCTCVSSSGQFCPGADVAFYLGQWSSSSCGRIFVLFCALTTFGVSCHLWCDQVRHVVSMPSDTGQWSCSSCRCRVMLYCGVVSFVIWLFCHQFRLVAIACHVMPWSRSPWSCSVSCSVLQWSCVCSVSCSVVQWSGSSCVCSMSCHVLQWSSSSCGWCAAKWTVQ